MPPWSARRRSDQLKKTNHHANDAAQNGPPVIRENTTRLHQNFGEHRQVPSGLLEQSGQLRDQVAHEEKNQADAQHKNHRRIDQRADDFFPQIIHRHQKRCLTP